MALRSLHQLLGNPDNQPPAVQQFQHLLKVWAEVAGASVAAQARPLSVERGVLQVATASSAWAQDLAFKRRRLLQQLNSRLSTVLPEPLTDIRFSPARWQETPVDRPALGSTQQAQSWAEHPSRLPADPGATDPVEPVGARETAMASGNLIDSVNPENSLAQLAVTPIESFERWATQVRSRSQALPLCPKCQCPTPPGELQRWQVCGVCAAKQWQE